MRRDELLRCIDAREVILGENVHFGDGVHISAIEGPAERVVIGDNVYFGNEVLILVPEFRIGDYGTIHKRCRLSGYRPLTIGHNFWCDQNCILNCTERLQIGNGVGIGGYSQLWTHSRHGDTLIGCRFDKARPMTIHDDVWFVGHCMVSPIEAKARSMALLGSTITRDMEENHVYGGCPARDLTDKLGPAYRDVPVEERRADMTRRVEAFFAAHPEFAPDRVAVVESFDGDLRSDVTYFNVADRTYTKRGTALEAALMWYLLPTAKFLPR